MSESFTVYLRDLFSQFGPVTLRKMFGGQGVYHDGIIIGLVVGEELFLKTDAATVDAFEAAGSRPFVYQGKGKPVAMSYWIVPDEAMESAHAMHPWARLAYAAAVRKHALKKPKNIPAKKAALKKVAVTKVAKKKAKSHARTDAKSSAHR